MLTFLREHFLLCLSSMMEHQPVACILPSNAPSGIDQPCHSASNDTRVLQERCGNRRDEPVDKERLRRAYDLLRETEPQFIADVQAGRFKAIEPCRLQDILHDSRKLWAELWKCEDFVKYRQRQPRDLESIQPPAQRNDKVWPDRSEVAFCRGKLRCLTIVNARLTG